MRGWHRPAVAAGERVDGGRALHQIDLTVADLERSTRYYAVVLPILGFERIADVEEGPLWRKAGFELGLQGARGAGRERSHDRYSPGLHHLAFAAPATGAVDAAHQSLVARGTTVNFTSVTVPPPPVNKPRPGELLSPGACLGAKHSSRGLRRAAPAKRTGCFFWSTSLKSGAPSGNAESS